MRYMYISLALDLMRTSEDRSGPLVTCIDNTGRSPVLTGELVPDDWHGLPVPTENKDYAWWNIACGQCYMKM